MYWPIYLERYSGASQGKYTKGLGQLQLAFTLPQEDSNSLALTGTLSLI
jgi:3-hydroxy-3-methylglutaryl CoA synthase